MLQQTKKIIKKLKIGDKVIVEKVTNPSLNLYTKAKTLGLNYIKCACHSRKGKIYEIQSNFEKGYLLKEVDENSFIVAHANDLRRI